MSLRQLAKREEATLFMVLLAAFKTLLYRYTQQEDIVVSSPMAGRSRLELEGLIGFFVNILPLRTKPLGKSQLQKPIEAGSRKHAGRLFSPGRAFRKNSRGTSS